MRQQAQAAQTPHRQLSEQEINRAGALGDDLQALWQHPSITPRDHKRLLRCLIEEVQLETEEKRYRIRIVWKGGAVSDREVVRRAVGTSCATAKDTIDLVRELAQEFDDTQIARVLNKQGRRTGLGNAFTKAKVESLRGHHRIAKCAQQRVQDPREGPFTADEAATELGVGMSTVHRWLRTGILAGEQLTPGATWRIVLTEAIRRRLCAGEAPAAWVGLSEAARRLGLPKSRVLYLVESGKLEAMYTSVRGRKCWRINVDTGRYSAQTELFDQMSNALSQEV